MVWSHFTVRNFLDSVMTSLTLLISIQIYAMRINLKINKSSAEQLNQRAKVTDIECFSRSNGSGDRLLTNIS